MSDLTMILSSYRAFNSDAAKVLYTPRPMFGSLRFKFIFPTSFLTGGMLLFERVEHWRRWNKRIFADCACGGRS